MRRSPPPVLANESLLVTVLPLTAILTDRLPAPVVGDGAAAAAHLEALTASGARHRGLFFVHGHRHRREWQLHSAALKLSAEQWLVRESDLLMVSTDITATTAEMVYLMGLYPQSTRMLIHTGVNTGYRCGLLHALSASHWIWHRHDSVVFTHPDVFLLPPAVHACMHVCMRACAPDDLLLQTQLTQQFTAVRTCIIHACMHACIRTRRLVAAPSGERGSHHSLTHSLSGLLTCAAQVYELGAYLAAHRSAHSLLATSTKMFWYRCTYIHIRGAYTCISVCSPGDQHQYVLVQVHINTLLTYIRTYLPTYSGTIAPWPSCPICSPFIRRSYPSAARHAMHMEMHMHAHACTCLLSSAAPPPLQQGHIGGTGDGHMPYQCTCMHAHSCMHTHAHVHAHAAHVCAYIHTYMYTYIVCMRCYRRRPHRRNR